MRRASCPMAGCGRRRFQHGDHHGEYGRITHQPMRVSNSYGDPNSYSTATAQQRRQLRYPYTDPYGHSYKPHPTAPASATPTATATPSCTPGYAFTSGTGTIMPGVTDTGNHCDDWLYSHLATVLSHPLWHRAYTSAAVGSNGHFTLAPLNNGGFTLSCMPVTTQAPTLSVPYLA